MMIANEQQAFRELVAGVSARLTPGLQAFDSNIRGVHFLAGHPIEIDETLRQYDELADKRYEKYPLVMLVEDVVPVA